MCQGVQGTLLLRIHVYECDATAACSPPPTGLFCVVDATSPVLVGGALAYVVYIIYSAWKVLILCAVQTSKTGSPASHLHSSAFPIHYVRI